jgi:hypothetical protein
MSLPALARNADTLAITTTVNRLVRAFNRPDSLPTIVGADTGTATAYAIAPVPGIVRYEVGQEFVFQAGHANSGPDPTLAVNGLAAGTIRFLDGTALAAGDIPSGGWVRAICASTSPTFAMVTCAASLRAALLTARGDLIVRGASAPQRLALGTAGQALLSDGTDAVWGSPIQRASIRTGAFASGTTTIPLDDTIPQSSEGNQYLSLGLTPRSAASTLVVDATLVCATSAAAWMVAAIFRDGDANALGAAMQYNDTASGGRIFRITCEAEATATTPTTFKLRAGAGSNTPATFYVNGTAGVRYLGGAMLSGMSIAEYA